MLRDFHFGGLTEDEKGGLKNNEKEQCYFYEFLRECYLRGGAVRRSYDSLLLQAGPLLQADVRQNVRQKLARNEFKTLSPPHSQAFQARLILHDLFVDIDGFPQTPWLNLRKDVRPWTSRRRPRHHASSFWASGQNSMCPLLQSFTGAKNKLDF